MQIASLDVYRYPLVRKVIDLLNAAHVARCLVLLLANHIRQMLAAGHAEM